MLVEQSRSPAAPVVSAPPAAPRVGGARDPGALRESSDATSTFERPHRPSPVQLFNGCGRLLRRCGWRRPVSAERILAVARRRAGRPAIWGGCSLFAWLRLLARNRLAVHPSRARVAATTTVISTVNTLLGWLQEARFGRRVNRTPIREAPLFVLGHWRSGTTLLHELLVLDERHAFPNFYQCLVPNHFLLTEDRGKRRLSSLIPARRDADNMAAGWDLPQEDEFALCLLGAPSPYASIAFPNHPPQDQEAFDLDRLSPRARAAWKRTFLRFLRQLTLKDPRRLVLKSPPHSCRVPTLLELFPDARFVHIVRDPYVVFPSMVHLWKSHYQVDGLQKPTFAGLEEYVFRTFTHLHERIQQGKTLISPQRFHELHYEDLVADPVGEMRRLYERLELGDFDKVLPRLQSYLQEHADYRTNRYPTLSAALRAEIGRRWGEVIRRYGYDDAAGERREGVPGKRSEDHPRRAHGESIARRAPAHDPQSDWERPRG